MAEPAVAHAKAVHGRWPCAVAAVLATAACASSPAQEAAKPPQPGVCDASKVQWAVGQTGDQATMGRIWRESGAGLIRPLIKGQAELRNEKPDRVNVHLDKDNRIVAVDCG